MDTDTNVSILPPMTYGTSTEPTPSTESGDGTLLDPVTALWMPDTANDRVRRTAGCARSVQWRAAAT